MSNKHEVLSHYTCGRDGWFGGMTVVGNEVMVCNMRQNCITVLTKDLQHVREISGSLQKPLSASDVSVDVHGNLYVADYKNHSIRVLSQDGTFIRSFGHDSKKGVNTILEDPRGVSVFGDYVYVIDSSSNTASVFTLTGEHVTTFEKKFNSPCSVCVDHDGFVYVCEYWNGKVQIF